MSIGKVTFVKLETTAIVEGIKRIPPFGVEESTYSYIINSLNSLL